MNEEKSVKCQKPRVIVRSICQWYKKLHLIKKMAQEDEKFDALFLSIAQQHPGGPIKVKFSKNLFCWNIIVLNPMFP